MLNYRHIKPQVVLDESAYGHGEPRHTRVMPDLAFAFYRYHDNGNFEFITCRRSAKLVAVSKEQFNAWGKMKIVAIECSVENGD